MYCCIRLFVFNHLCLRTLRKMAPLVNGTSHSNSQPNSKVFPLQTYANAISSAADVITDYCTSNHLPHPSFRPDAPKITIPLTAPLAIHSARQTLIDSATKIQQVITEPADYLPRLAVHVGFDWLLPPVSFPLFRGCIYPQSFAPTTPATI